MFSDNEAPGGSPSIISGYNDLDFEFFGSNPSSAPGTTPRFTLKDHASSELHILGINSALQKAYFDGQIINTGLNNAFNNKELDTIFSAGDSVANYDGKISEFLIFNRQLTDNEVKKIQNYLATKWNLTTSVDSDGDGIVDKFDTDPKDPNKWMVMPSVLRKSSTDSYTPLDELELWYDATNTDGNNNLSMSNGASIDIWRDLSGNTNHVSQTTDSKKPTLITNSNKQYLSFDGSNDSLEADLTGHILDDPTGKNVTIFTVVKPKQTSGESYILSTGGQTNSAVGYAFGTDEGVEGWSIFKDQNGGKTIQLSESFHTNQTHLVTHSYKSSFNEYEVLMNGSLETDLGLIYGGASNGHHFLTIGRPNNGNSYYGNFEIAEVIVLSSTDSQKINDIQYYLSNKWGLTESIDSDGDGFTDFRETSGGSSPTDSSSLPYYLGNNSTNPGSSCLNIHQSDSTLIDRKYWIDITPDEAGDSFEVYCHNMATGNPKEYLELVKVGSDVSSDGYYKKYDSLTNISSQISNNLKFNYALNYFNGDQFEFQEYSKVRLELSPLAIVVSDQTFSTFSNKDMNDSSRHGNANHGKVDYGTAAACVGTGAKYGKANIDLTGTPFKAPPSINTFTKHGWPGGSGTFVWSNNDQVINITGGDHCGHVQVSETQSEKLFLEFD